jgi:hypothetical protein
LLSCDADRAVVRVANPGGNTPDRLHCRIGDCNSVGAQTHCFDEVRWRSDPACDDQRHIGAIRFIEMSPGPGECWNGGNGNVVTEDQWSRACAAPAPVENDLVGVGVERKVDVFLNVLSRQLESNRDSARDFADIVSKILVVPGCREFGERWW